MRRLVLFATLVALFAQSGCVQSQYVPNNLILVPTPTVSPVAAPLAASPSSLTLSASATVPPNPTYPTIAVTQAGTNQAPFVIQAQSTCLTNNNLFIVSSSSLGSSTTFALQAFTVGQCVLVFGGVDGTTLTVPVTVRP